MNNLQVLSASKIKTIFFVFTFVFLAVITPMLAHYFGGVMAGRLFLPMPFFVLVAGLSLGWRAGLATALLVPVISYSLTGMPSGAILPFILIEMAGYGFFAGFLREKVKNIWVSLFGALIFGRMFLALAIALLPTKLIADQYIFGAISVGWRGIVLQIILVPLAVMMLGKFLQNERV